MPRDALLCDAASLHLAFEFFRDGLQKVPGVEVLIRSHAAEEQEHLSVQTRAWLSNFTFVDNNATYFLMP